MTMLFISQLLLTGSLAFIVRQNFSIYKTFPDKTSLLFFVIPLVTIVMQGLLNFSMCIVHKKELTTASCTVPKLIYIPSALIGYHALSLCNITFATSEPKEEDG